MNKIIITDANKEEIHRLLKRIPFFSSVLESDASQFDKLLSLADIIEVSPGETVINKGATDMYLYFLLKGQLAVFLDDTQINYVSPGEVFGVLSMVTHTPRSAMIKAADGAKATLLYKLNFAYLNDESEKSELKLATKIYFYRMAVHNIRWTLEQKKMADPKNPMVHDLLKLPIVKAEKNTHEELLALKDQSKRLSDLVLQWNQYDMGDKTVIRF